MSMLVVNFFYLFDFILDLLFYFISVGICVCVCVLFGEDLFFVTQSAGSVWYL